MAFHCCLCCLCRLPTKPQAEPMVTVCNKEQHITNDFILFWCHVEHVWPPLFPALAFHFTSAWQNWNKLKEKMQLYCPAVCLIWLLPHCFIPLTYQSVNWFLWLLKLQTHPQTACWQYWSSHVWECATFPVVCRFWISLCSNCSQYLNWLQNSYYWLIQVDWFFDKYSFTLKL